MTTPVSFELAKLLKEKEFNLKVKQRWGIVENIDGDKTPFCQHDCGLFNWNNEKYADYISAPTIAEVVMWCFNKYKYSIEYSMNISESGEYDGCYVFNGLIKGSEDYKLKIFYTSKDYPTVEKALEYTINHFLVNFC